MTSQKKLHTSPSQASYGVPFVSILKKDYYILERFDCIFPSGHLLESMSGGDSVDGIIGEGLATIQTQPLQSGGWSK